MKYGSRMNGQYGLKVQLTNGKVLRYTNMTKERAKTAFDIASKNPQALLVSYVMPKGY